MKTLDGVSVSLGELSVELPLLLNYFNTQCPFCQHEIAEILVDEQLQEMALLVFISDEPPETVMAFQREMSLDQEPKLVFLYDENRIIRDYFGICPGHLPLYKGGKANSVLQGSGENRDTSLTFSTK